MPPFPLENTPLNNPVTEPTNQFSLPPVRQMANLNYFVPTHLLHFGFFLCLTKKSPTNQPTQTRKPNQQQKKRSTYFY